GAGDARFRDRTAVAWPERGLANEGVFDSRAFPSPLAAAPRRRPGGRPRRSSRRRDGCAPRACRIDERGPPRPRESGSRPRGVPGGSVGRAQSVRRRSGALVVSPGVGTGALAALLVLACREATEQPLPSEP